MTQPDLVTTLARLGDHNQPLALGQLKALSDLDAEGLELLRSEWPAFELSQRRAIAQAMQELAEASLELEFRDPFLIMLEDEDAQVRSAALAGLWEDTRRSTLRSLIHLLNADPDEGVRASAATALGAWTLRSAQGSLDARATAEVEQALLVAYGNSAASIQVRRRALEALGYLGATPAVEAAIVAASGEADELWQQSAICAMGRSGTTRWRRTIATYLPHDSSAIRYEAARAVGELGDEGRPLLKALAPLVADPDTEVALAAIWALGQVGGTAARRLLEGLVKEAEGARLETAESALNELKFFEDPMRNLPLGLDDDDEDE